MHPGGECATGDCKMHLAAAITTKTAAGNRNSNNNNHHNHQRTATIQAVVVGGSQRDTESEVSTTFPETVAQLS